MQERPTSAEIDDEAATWAVRLDGPAAASVDRAAFEAWLASDVRRRGAYARAVAILKAAEAQAPAVATGSSRRAPTHTRRWVWPAAATAAACLAAALILPSHLTPRFHTAVGEFRSIPLPDGSVASLNTDSAIALSYDRAGRAVTLLRGEVLFEVAKDPARPFVVAAGPVKVRAVGTAFVVTRDAAGDVDVLVRHGVVEIRRTGTGAGAPIPASADTRVGLPAARPATVEALDTRQVARRLAWTQGMLAFEDTPLSRAADQFSRYGGVRIVIDDPDVGARTVTGLFSARDPKGFAEAAAASLGLRAVAEGEAVRLSR